MDDYAVLIAPHFCPLLRPVSLSLFSSLSLVISVFHLTPLCSPFSSVVVAGGGVQVFTTGANLSRLVLIRKGAVPSLLLWVNPTSIPQTTPTHPSLHTCPPPTFLCSGCAKVQIRLIEFTIHSVNVWMKVHHIHPQAW